MSEPMRIDNPLVIIFPTAEGSINTVIMPREKDTHEHFGLLIYDLVRHTAKAFKVSEDEVWEWVQRERRHPTTDIKRPS